MRRTSMRHFWSYAAVVGEMYYAYGGKAVCRICGGDNRQRQEAGSTENRRAAWFCRLL